MSVGRRKSSDNLSSSMLSAAHPSAASPSHNSLDRLDLNQRTHPQRSNPHSARRTALRSLKRGFLPWRLSDAGRRIRRAAPHAAGIRNPSQKQTSRTTSGQSAVLSKADIVVTATEDNARRIARRRLVSRRAEFGERGFEIESMLSSIFSLPCSHRESMLAYKFHRLTPIAFGLLFLDRIAE